MIYCLSVIAYIAGVPAAWAFGRYLISIEKRLPLPAALWDMAIIALSTLITLSLWSISGDSPAVFLGYMLGNGTGTYLVVRHARKREDRN